MWQDLPRLRVPVALVAGELDAKFVTISRHMARVMAGGGAGGRGARVHLVRGAGHAVHLEQPLALLQLLGGGDPAGPAA